MFTNFYNFVVIHLIDWVIVASSPSPFHCLVIPGLFLECWGPPYSPLFSLALVKVILPCPLRSGDCLSSPCVEYSSNIYWLSSHDLLQFVLGLKCLYLANNFKRQLCGVAVLVGSYCQGLEDAIQFSLAFKLANDNSDIILMVCLCKWSYIFS